jgi:hypothetical protein
MLAVHELAFKALAEVLAFVLVKFWCIQSVCEALPPFCLAQMGLGREMAKPLSYAAVGMLFVNEEGICAPYEDGRYEHYGIELTVQGGAQTNGEIPYAYNGNIDKYLGQGGDAVTDTYAHEGVVQVCLVGTERTLAMEYAHGHYTKCVGYGYRKDCYHHGGGAIVMRERITMACIVHGAHNEPCHEYAHNHGSGVTDEHATLLAKDIMHKEMEQGGCHGECQNGIDIVAYAKEIESEEHAAGYAQTRRKAIDTVHHVDCVDDTHSGKDGKRNCYRPGDIGYAPEAMERVYTDAGREYHTQDNKYLYGKTCLGR